MPGPTLEGFAVDGFVGDRFDRFAIDSDEGREEIDHVDLRIIITGVDLERGDDLRGVVA